MERYTAEQLQNQSKEELIDMYIYLQNNYLNPMKSESGRILAR